MVPVRRHARHWGAYLAGGGLVLILVTELVLAYSAPAWNPTQHRPKHTEHAYNDAEQTDREGAESSTPISKKYTKSEYTAPDDQTAPHDEEGSPKWTDIVNTILTGVLALSTIGLWVATHRLFRAGEKQIDLAEQNTEVALAALARPWIFIQGLEHNITSWRVDNGFFAELHLANYGNAPAIINGIRLVYFLSPGRNKIPASLENFIPRHVWLVPKPDELEAFLQEHGRKPQLRQRPGLDVESRPDRNISFFNRSDDGPTTLILPNCRTENVFVQAGPTMPPATDESIPIELAMHRFLLGRITYSTPDGGIETLTFCYQGDATGGFSMIGAAPYNQHKKHPRRLLQPSV